MALEKQESIESVMKDIDHQDARKKELMTDVKTFQQRGINLLTTIVKEVVDLEDKVEVGINQGEHTTVFEIKVDKTDLGKVIGKQGRMATSIRRVFHGFSQKNKRKSVIEIVQ